MKPRPPSKAELAALTRASCSNPTVTLRASGAAVSDAIRNEMLARCAAKEHVELELELLAYEQKPSESNRNFVRFRDGALMALGRSGVGTPFLRDHDQGDAMARGGTVIASQTEKRGEGDYAIRQTVKLTAPWAVELALRGLLDTVSIGWNPTGGAMGAPTCSVCAINFWRCSHLPGQRYRVSQDDAGVRSYVADAAGPMVCERVYAAAELVETSAVNVPAVPAAQIDAIRAALSAHNSGTEPHEEEMNQFPKLLAALGLAATAGEPEVIAAVESLNGDRAELKVVKTELAAANAELGTIRAAKRKADEDKIFADTIARGAMAPASEDEKAMREFYAVAPDRASVRLAARTDNSVTPAGAPRQSGTPAPIEPDATKLGAAAETIAKSGGSSVAAVRKNLISMGYSPADADKQIARHIGGVKEA